MKKFLTRPGASAVCGASNTVDRSEKDPFAQRERREVPRSVVCERIAEYERFNDSLVMSRNFQSTRRPCSSCPQVPCARCSNRHSTRCVDATRCLPSLHHRFRTPLLRYGAQLYRPSCRLTAEHPRGWLVTFTSPLFSRFDYTFTFEIYSRTSVDAYHRQSALQLRAVFGNHFAALLMPRRVRPGCCTGFRTCGIAPPRCAAAPP